MPNAQSIDHNDETRLQALALVEFGIANKIVTVIIEISRRSIGRLQKQVRDRNYNPSKSKKLLLFYMTDASRFGRSSIITFELESVIIAVVRKDRYKREKISFMLVAE